MGRGARNAIPQQLFVCPNASAAIVLILTIFKQIHELQCKVFFEFGINIYLILSEATSAFGIIRGASGDRLRYKGTCAIIAFYRNKVFYDNDNGVRDNINVCRLTPRNTHHGILDKNTVVFFSENPFVNVVYQMPPPICLISPLLTIKLSPSR